MRNGRPKAALLILLLALFVLTGPGAPTNHTGSSTTNATTVTATATTTTTATAASDTNTDDNRSTVLRNLTIGYLTAAKGSLENRQGLSISGALTLALKEVSVKTIGMNVRTRLFPVEKSSNSSVNTYVCPSSRVEFRKFELKIIKLTDP